MYNQAEVHVYETEEQWNKNDPFVHIMPWVRVPEFLISLDITFYDGVYSISIWEHNPEAAEETEEKKPLLTKTK